MNESYYPPGYGYPIDTPTNESTLVQQTNPKETLLNIEMALRGKIEQVNPETNQKEWVLPIGCKPLINMEGINSLMVDARSVINQNTTLSNYSEEQISRIIIRLGRTIKNKIKMNWKEWEIDKSNLTTVVFSITDPSYASLLRAKSEGERKFIKTTTRAVESFVSNIKPEQSSSITDKIKFWR